MRKTAYILIIIILQLISCKKSTIAETENYIESKPSFFELHNENWLTNKWIRKPENLLIIHETFKKVGYNDLIGTYLSDNPLIIQDLYINKNGNNILDSLLITYKENEKGTKYYTEFWARRKKEKNKSEFQRNKGTTHSILTLRHRKSSI